MFRPYEWSLIGRPFVNLFLQFIFFFLRLVLLYPSLDIPHIRSVFYSITPILCGPFSLLMSFRVLNSSVICPSLCAVSSLFTLTGKIDAYFSWCELFPAPFRPSPPFCFSALPPSSVRGPSSRKNPCNLRFHPFVPPFHGNRALCFTPAFFFFLSLRFGAMPPRDCGFFLPHMFSQFPLTVFSTFPSLTFQA